ncbi:MULTISPECIES: MFS transporter [Paenibacillus]|uniref:MFS transporter n=1 Tax=Paenibacillus TaxID=44249 RepID=UPI0007BFD8AA|nr:MULTISPECIES: MFS transporter [Paenibacillus]MCZ1264508.1 MFS transporter [Paenibacillus tundrae]SDM02397.1 Predicted arabinose efflux permease, MFS family [Paenibacillus sp. OK060]SEB27098.1 Predicted arabinose efflux permease, MFS family [Paenibacillus sp. 276b]SHN83698.1 Predicted arabinose efflux permease, MFS family [Paenibacillus sp. ov031]
MKTAIWLYLFLFLAVFDLHAQYPILTPFAISLGAAPTFIGWMMGIYSLTHLPGNLIAGTQIDKHGSRRYIVFSLLGAGIILLIQAQIHTPWQLLALRSISGFVLAFLSPACLALLAQLSSDPIKQGKYMSGHGVVHTLASVVSPAAGALIVGALGFSATFASLGYLLILSGVIAWLSMPKGLAEVQHEKVTEPAMPSNPVGEKRKFLPVSWRYFALPLVIACAQGILFFELPLRGGGHSSMMSTGLLFSIISIGALFTLSLLFLNRYSPKLRLIAGVLLMSLCFFAMAAIPQIPLSSVLFVLGMSKGIIFPAMATLFIHLSGGNKLGRIFSLQSIATSIGSFIGPITAGQLRVGLSPYFIAFVLLMIGIMLLPYFTARREAALSDPKSILG